MGTTTSSTLTAKCTATREQRVTVTEGVVSSSQMSTSSSASATADTCPGSKLGSLLSALSASLHWPGVRTITNVRTMRAVPSQLFSRAAFSAIAKTRAVIEVFA